MVVRNPDSIMIVILREFRSVNDKKTRRVHSEKEELIFKNLALVSLVVVS
jgi:hypothetical protein